ncbi:MAG: outer membrane beta-barrel protein [Alphaproteobacteria bacterium]|nr:outer membrane beta-barrel protein [Alphaproteobacteria bacterium]
MSVLYSLVIIVLSIFCCSSVADAQSSWQYQRKTALDKLQLHFSLPLVFSPRNISPFAYNNIAHSLRHFNFIFPSFAPQPANLSFASLPAANKSKWEGLYLGIASVVQHVHNDFPKAANSLNKDIFFGYDKLLGNNILLGAECGFSLMNAKGYAQVTPYSDQHKLVNDNGWNTHLQLHAGYVWNNLQAYLATDVNKSSFSANGANKWQAPSMPAFGGGIEYAIKPGLRLRLGYRRNKLAYKSVTVKHSPMPTTPRTAVTNYQVENFSVGLILHWH